MKPKLILLCLLETEGMRDRAPFNINDGDFTMPLTYPSVTVPSSGERLMLRIDISNYEDNIMLRSPQLPAGKTAVIDSLSGVRQIATNGQLFPIR